MGKNVALDIELRSGAAMTTVNIASALLALALFCRPARKTPVRGWMVAAAVTLFALAIVAVPVAVDSLHRLPSPLNGVLAEGRQVSLDSLTIEDRRMLNRLVGRRRNIELAIEGYVVAPRHGSYRFELDCDDRCSLSLDGRALFSTDRDDHVAVDLTQGVHAVRIDYVQRGGAAHLRFSWERPGLIQFLPSTQLTSGRAEDLTPWRVAIARAKLVGIGAGILLVYGGFLFLWSSIGPALKRGLWSRLRAWWQASASTTQQPQRLPRAVRAKLGTVFFVALVARLTALFGQDMPILFGHPYNYYENALRILEHHDPWNFLLRSDEWHLWQSWTVAPLYYGLLAVIFLVFGPGFTPFRLVHALLSAASAVGVAVLGRRLCGPNGWWAGLAYALFWPAIELLQWTLTENLHTPLFLLAFVLLLRESDAPGHRRAFGAGVVLGLSAMTRAVSSAFFAVVFLWRLFREGVSIDEIRRNWSFAVAIGIGGALAILPWTARNVLVLEEPVLIETVSFFNLVYDNEPRAEKRDEVFRLGPGQERRQLATDVGLRGIQEQPGHFIRKASANFWHILRPDGLHYWLNVNYPEPRWRHVTSVVLGDVPMLLSIVLFTVWLFAGRASPARLLTLAWVSYYLLLVVVLFHNEIRYRNVLLPFFFAAAPAGIAALGSARRTLRCLAGLALGLVIAAVLLVPYPGKALRGLRASWALRPAKALIESGAIDEANRAASRAAALAGSSPAVRWRYGSWLAKQRHAEHALDVYREALPMAPVPWTSVVVQPQLLRESDNTGELREAIDNADHASATVDPWIMLEIAWRELPPPITDTVNIGDGDYGAVRGFTSPQENHRFTLGRAWVRFVPTYRATQHRVLLEMSSPALSPLDAPEVHVSVNGQASRTFVLDRTVREYAMLVETQPGEPIVVRIDAPLWSRAGARGPQGVRVDRVRARP